MLQDKSIHELRQIAQGHGIGEIFSMDMIQLRQAIEQKQIEMLPKPEIVVPRPEYDASLMTKPPSKKTDQAEMEKLLQAHIARGLVLTFPDQENWQMQFGKVTDSGTMRMPSRVVLNCAEKVMR